jgi:CheY-like chemotaxis protein
VIADADVEFGSVLANTMVSWGLRPLLVHDGVEAILGVQRSLPTLVILDAGLPKMFGFQVCELIKRNESLKSIQVVLIAAIHHSDRYRRDPNELYGADVYVERPQLPEALKPILRDLGLVTRTEAEAPEAPREPETPVPVAMETPPTVAPAVAAPAPEPAPVPAPEPVPQPEPVAVADSPEPAPAQAAPPADASLAEKIAEAERLARIIVSDVVLYNEEKFAAAVRSGDVVEELQSELQEGRAHFQQRIDARVRESKDFLAEELLRVARTRGLA